MEITPEKLAFIQGTKPPENGPVAKGPEPSQILSSRPEADEANERGSSRRHQHSKSARRQTERIEAASHTADPSILQGLLVPLTTRLQPETADALRRAYLEQKLARKNPATQQEIIEAALQAWLKVHAYL
jgi:hypothetical protein